MPGTHEGGEEKMTLEETRAKAARHNAAVRELEAADFVFC